MWIFTFQSKNIRVGEKELREKKKSLFCQKGHKDIQMLPFQPKQSKWVIVVGRPLQSQLPTIILILLTCPMPHTMRHLEISLSLALRNPFTWTKTKQRDFENLGTVELACIFWNAG